MVITKPSGRKIMKFGTLKMENYKRVYKFNYKKNFYLIYVDKNDSVYDIKKSEISSWKTITAKNGKKVNVPDEKVESRDVALFDKIKGNPYKTAVNKIMAEIDYTV